MFSVEEVALLGSIADQVGVVVESARLREQAEQAAVVEERTRLARDLHDSVTQLMYSINLFATVGQKSYRLGDAEKMNSSLVHLSETAQQALKELRLLVYELRPPALEKDSLVEALRHRLEMVEERANMEVHLQVDDTIALPDAVEEEFYHIAQEALNNALKHAAATAVTVRLDAGVDQIELEISDNGRGVEHDTSELSGGLGLISMRERVERLGGELTVLSVPGVGTTVKATLDMGGSNGP